MSRDPLRHHRRGHTKGLMGDSLAERVSEKVATGMGTVAFVVSSTVIIALWIAANGLTHGWDPYPFILLNLVFSAVAFYTGALVIISQKSQAKRDRASQLADALHREELAKENARMLVANTVMTKQIHDLTIGQNEILASLEFRQRHP